MSQVVFEMSYKDNLVGPFKIIFGHCMYFGSYTSLNINEYKQPAFVLHSIKDSIYHPPANKQTFLSTADGQPLLLPESGITVHQLHEGDKFVLTTIKNGESHTQNMKIHSIKVCPKEFDDNPHIYKWPEETDDPRHIVAHLRLLLDPDWACYEGDPNRRLLYQGNNYGLRRDVSFKVVEGKLIISVFDISIDHKQKGPTLITFIYDKEISHLQVIPKANDKKAGELSQHLSCSLPYPDVTIEPPVR